MNWEAISMLTTANLAIGVIGFMESVGIHSVN